MAGDAEEQSKGRRRGKGSMSAIFQGPEAVPISRPQVLVGAAAGLSECRLDGGGCPGPPLAHPSQLTPGRPTALNCCCCWLMSHF